MKDIWSVFLIFFIQIIFNVLWLFLLFSEKMPVAASIVGFISLPILFLLVYDVWVIEKKSAKYFSIALICITYRLFISVGVALNH